MSTQPGAATSLAGNNPEPMDEAQLNQAMKRLKLLYIKVRKKRSQDFCKVLFPGFQADRTALRLDC
jgi:hypothetical protein